MLKKTKDNMDEEKSFMYKQTHEGIMKQVKQKSKSRKETPTEKETISPTGGKRTWWTKD